MSARGGWGLVIALALAGCGIDRRSDGLRCDNGTCPGGQICSLGYCVPGPDADTCPEACTTCTATTCLIDCGADGTACDGGAVCPPGLECTVRCGGGECDGGVDCTQAASCAVTCEGSNSCGGGVTCGAGPCDVSCDGPRACEGGVVCGTSCRCDVECSGNLACDGGVTCSAAACQVDTLTCDSAQSGCDTCL